MEEQKDLSLELQNIFQGTSGEEDMLRVATKYTLQLNSKQTKILTFLRFLGRKLIALGHLELGQNINDFVEDYLEFKQYQKSNLFVMKLFEFLSLKKFLGQGMNVDIKKQ